MNTLRSLLLSATTLLLVLGSVMPAVALEGGAADEGKSQLIMRSFHHQVGAVILFFAGILVVAALINARNQLKGRRGQADGKFRWR